MMGKTKTTTKNKPDAFADILRDAVRASDKTLYRLALETGIGQDQLSRFVREERGLSLETAGVLAVALGYQLKRG
jgi:plasmid maintenance system antidote protein VapI